MFLKDLGCKGKKVIVANFLKLKMDKQVLLQIGNMKMAWNWLSNQVEFLLDCENKRKSVSKFPYVGFDNTLIIFTPDKKIATIDTYGLKELEVTCNVERRFSVTTTFDELLEANCMGFVDSSLDAVYKAVEQFEKNNAKNEVNKNGEKI